MLQLMNLVSLLFDQFRLQLMTSRTCWAMAMVLVRVTHIDSGTVG